MLDFEIDKCLREVFDPRAPVRDGRATLTVEQRMRYRGFLLRIATPQGGAVTPEVLESVRNLDELTTRDLFHLVDESLFLLRFRLDDTILVQYLNERLTHSGEAEIAVLRESYREREATHKLWKKLKWPTSLAALLSRLQSPEVEHRVKAQILTEILPLLPSQSHELLASFFEVLSTFLSESNESQFDLIREAVLVRVTQNRSFHELGRSLLARPTHRRHHYMQLLCFLLASGDPGGTNLRSDIAATRSPGTARAGWLRLLEGHAYVCKRNKEALPDDLLAIAFSLPEPTTQDLEVVLRIARNTAESRIQSDQIENGVRWLLENIQRNADGLGPRLLTDLGVFTEKVSSGLARQLMEFASWQMHTDSLGFEAALGLLSCKGATSTDVAIAWSTLEASGSRAMGSRQIGRLLKSPRGIVRFRDYLDGDRISGKPALDSPLVQSALANLAVHGATAQAASEVLQIALTQATQGPQLCFDETLASLQSARLSAPACKKVVDELLRSRPGILKDESNFRKLTRLYAAQFR